ncbi:MAG: hypothetical protein J5J00_12945 [Deltaproteobacteria bacterium]|nr:hypothetical protein [Deltaproteobacteria bacterium]
MQVAKSLPIADRRELEQAFAKFSEASHKLEAKYEELLKETEILRSALREKEQEVRRAERLSMLGETAAALAHEVRNPLGAMRLFLSLLRREVGERGDAANYVNQIDKSISTLDNVVSNILQFSKTQNVAMGPLNLNALILEQVALFGGPAPQIEIVTELHAAPYIIGNEHGLRQMIYNLLLNSMQAMKNPGRITVSTKDDDDGIVVCFKDEGPGIPADKLSRIFDPFYTTKSEGTGLGLAVVKQIVIQHSGSVSAANNDGAVFEVRFPRSSSKTSSRK